MFSNSDGRLCSISCNPLGPKYDFLLGIRVGGLSISLLKDFGLGDVHIGSNTGGDKSPIFDFDTFSSSSLPCRKDFESSFSFGRFIGLIGDSRWASLLALVESKLSLYFRGRPGLRLTGVHDFPESDSTYETD